MNIRRGELVNTTQRHRQKDALNADYLHSAFIIDEHGNEVRITRDMITESCKQLVASDEAKSPLYYSCN